MPAVCTRSHEFSDTCGEKAVIYVNLNTEGEPSWCRKRHENNAMMRGGRFSCSQALRKLQPCRDVLVSAVFLITYLAYCYHSCDVLVRLRQLQLTVWICSGGCMSCSLIAPARDSTRRK